MATGWIAVARMDRGQCISKPLDIFGLFLEYDVDIESGDRCSFEDSSDTANHDEPNIVSMEGLEEGEVLGLHGLFCGSKGGHPA